MDEHRDQSTNATVVVGAGIAAALLAGVVLWLGRRRREPAPAIERAGERVDAAADRARAAGQRVAEAVPEVAAAAETKALAAARRGRRRLARLTAAERRAVAEAADEVERLRRRAWNIVGRGERKGHAVTDQVREQAPRVGAETTSAAQAIAAQAAATAVARAERALGIGASLADAARERAPQVAQRFGEDVVPSLREIALHAASTALDLWHEARERAQEAPGELRRPATQAAHLAAVGGERAREARTAIAERAADLARDAGRRAAEARVERARDATRRTAEAAVDRAKGASRRTAEATVETSKDTGAFLFWGGAAAGLVFYALLSPERREQLSRGAEAAWTQVQDLIQDFQGYDDEF